MGKKRAVRLQFPMGGQDESQAYQSAHPYTTPDSQNVRPSGTIERRSRGGSRPGLMQSAGLSGATMPFPAAIRLMTQMDHQKTDGYSIFTDDFNTDTIGGHWSSAGINLLTSYKTKYVAPTASLNSNGQSGAYLRDLTGMDETQPYLISIEIDPREGLHQGEACRIWFGMEASPSIFVEGIEAIFTINAGGAFSGVFKQVINSSTVINQAFQNPGTDASDKPGVFSVHVNVLTVTAYWRGVSIGTVTLDSYGCGGGGGRRLGLGLDYSATGNPLVNWYRIEYDDNDTGQRSTGIIVSNGVPYYEQWIDRYTAVANLGGITLPTGKLMLSAKKPNVLYIADPTAIRTYTKSTDTLGTLTATEGAVPTGCPLIALYRDRLVVAGADASPNQWFMSRQGTLTDWDYDPSGGIDAGAAVTGSSNQAGAMGEPIRAMAAWLDDTMIFGCTNSLWALRGDPVAGGEMNNLSRKVGIVDLASWCFGPSGELIFLSADGIYYLEPSHQGRPKSISREKLPDELRHVDRNSYTVLMAYDHEHRGVHIYLTSEDKRKGKHWWLAWPDGTFWPVELQDDHEPTAILEYQSYDPSQNAVILGGRDFYVRKYDNNAHDDDGTEITSYVSLGPIRLGDDYHDGMLAELWGKLAAGSGDVTWSAKPSDTPEGTIDAAVAESGTWTAGANGSSYPRVRAGSLLIRIENIEDEPGWAYESGGAVLQKLGKHRIE